MAGRIASGVCIFGDGAFALTQDGGGVLQLLVWNIDWRAMTVAHGKKKKCVI